MDCEIVIIALHIHALVARRPHSAAAIIMIAETIIFVLNSCPVEMTTTIVESKGVRNANIPMRRGSPAFIAASQRKKAPPRGPMPNMAIRIQSENESVTAGSNKKWQTRESTPDNAAKLPTAAVSK